MNPNVTIIPSIINETPDQKIRVAAYCRVSSDSSDQLNSFMAQLRYYENFLDESKTETLIGVYADEGITGTRMDKRDDFLRLLKDCKKGKIDRVIAKSISRFARNTKECLSIIRELKELGITVFFEKENIDTANISDEMMITIMGGLAQEESTSISQNLKWSFQKRCQNGNINVFSSPFGYRLDNGKLEICENEAVVVKDIFDMYLSGLGYQSILRICRQKYSDYKAVFSYYGILYILRNEKYIGNCEYQKTYTTNTLPFKKVKNKGEQNRYYLSNTHSPIISTETFNTVQKIIEQRHFNQIKNTYPLSRKIVCGNCETIYKRKRANEKIYWICRKHDESALSCNSKRLPEKTIYEAFITLYNKLKANYSIIFPPLISQLQELKNKKFSNNHQYTNISREIAQFREQMHVLSRLKTKGFIDECKYLSQTTEINAKIDKLNRELRKISRCNDEQDIIDQIKHISSIIENGTELMIDFDEIIFESLIEKIIVTNNELELQLYGGLSFIEKAR